MFAVRALLKRALRLNLERDLARGVDVRQSVALHEQLVEAIAAHDPILAEAARDTIISRPRRPNDLPAGLELVRELVATGQRFGGH
jgi:hypothetical protein